MFSKITNLELLTYQQTLFFIHSGYTQESKGLNRNCSAFVMLHYYYQQYYISFIISSWTRTCFNVFCCLKEVIWRIWYFLTLWYFLKFSHDMRNCNLLNWTNLLDLSPSFSWPIHFVCHNFGPVHPTAIVRCPPKSNFTHAHFNDSWSGNFIWIFWTCEKILHHKQHLDWKDGESITVRYVDILMNLCIGNCLNILDSIWMKVIEDSK